MNTGGRPYPVATLPEEIDELTIRIAFLKVVRSLSYRERQGIANALYITPESIRTNWQNGRSWPGLDTAYRVILWNEGGRKLETKKHTVSLGNL